MLVVPRPDGTDIVLRREETVIFGNNIYGEGKCKPQTWTSIILPTGRTVLVSKSNWIHFTHIDKFLHYQDIFRKLEQKRVG